MTLDDGAFNAEMAASLLKALRENSGPRGQIDSINGQEFSTGEYFSAVADGTGVNIYVGNPPDSGVVLFPKGTFRSSGQIAYHKVDSVTVDSAGAKLDSDNRLIGNGVSVATTESNVSYSGGNQWTRKTSGGSVSGGGLAPAVAGDFDIVLDEGQNVVYRLENTSGTEIVATIDVDYSEISRNEINKIVTE